MVSLEGLVTLVSLEGLESLTVNLRKVIRRNKYLEKQSS